MRNFIIFVILVVGAVHAADIIDCGSQVGTVSKVEIPGCDDQTKCLLKRNTNVSIEITFVPKIDIDVVNAVVHGILLSVPIPFHLPQPNGCLDSGLQCPLSAGQSYTYKAELPVLQLYPRVTVEVQWELQDKEGKDITCSKIPAKIV